MSASYITLLTSLLNQLNSEAILSSLQDLLQYQHQQFHVVAYIRFCSAYLQVKAQPPYNPFHLPQLCHELSDCRLFERDQE